MNFTDLPAVGQDEESVDAPDAGNDRVRSLVHAALAIYLLPAFVIVMAVGGVLVAATGAAKLASNVSQSLGLARRTAHPGLPKRVKAPLGGRFGNFASSVHVEAHRAQDGRGPSVHN